ncbi:MAG: hypothetical protein Q7S65_00475 [Nanoarchaeota archaeon]|nr:hypothetical protein [Nanoarchaeota archaeon]
MNTKTMGLTAALALAGCASGLEQKVDNTQFQDPAPLVAQADAPSGSALQDAIAHVPMTETMKPTFGYNAVKVTKDHAGTTGARVYTEAGVDFPVGDDPWNLTVKSISFQTGAHYSDAIKALGDTSKTMIRVGPKAWDTIGLVNLYGSSEKVDAEVGVWDMHLHKWIGSLYKGSEKDASAPSWLGESYGRTELTFDPNGDSAHALLFLGQNFDFGKPLDFPLGKTQLELTEGMGWNRETGRGTSQEIELNQYVGPTPIFLYARLGATDHRFGDSKPVLGVALDIGMLGEMLFGKTQTSK